MKASPALPAALRFHHTPLPKIQLKNGPRGKFTRVHSNGDWECKTDPSGRYAYILESLHAYLRQWHIGSDGILRPLSPHQVNAHSHPEHLRFHPNGRFAYVSCSYGAICQYRVRSGLLIPLKPAEVYAYRSPSAVWFDKAGSYACVFTPAIHMGHPDTDCAHIYRVGKEGRLELVHKILARGATSKISKAAFEGSIASFTVSGDDLGR